MHIVVTVRRPTVAEQNHDLVDTLRVLAEIIPEHICVLEMRLRIPLLRVDEVWELGGITNEENGRVIEDPVPITLVGAKLKGKASRVTSSVGTSRLATDSTETHRRAHLLARRRQETI